MDPDRLVQVDQYDAQPNVLHISAEIRSRQNEAVLLMYFNLNLEVMKRCIL